MSTHSRPERVAQLIQHKLGELFARGGLKDPRLGLVTVTGAKISPDLRQARVYWTVHGDEAVRKSTQLGLEAARGFLRREIGHSLGLRVVPDLAFLYDEAIDRGDRINQLLQEVREAEQRRVAEAPPDAAGSADGAEAGAGAPGATAPGEGAEQA